MPVTKKKAIVARSSSASPERERSANEESGGETEKRRIRGAREQDDVLPPKVVLSAAEIRRTYERLCAPSTSYLTKPTLAGRMAYCVRHPHEVQVLEDVVVTDVACGLDHVMVMTDKHVVLSWGRNDSGQIGQGNVKHSSTPVPLAELQSKKIRDFCCGAAHSVALTENGEVYTWGAGNMGQLGHGRRSKEVSPLCVAPLKKCHVLQVACGGAHTLALTSAREVYSWGAGGYGQLGHGDLADCVVPHQLRVLHGIDIKLLLAGDSHSAALTNFGEVFTWGRGEYGQLGHGDEANRRTPFPIRDLQAAQNSVCYLACGGDHMIAITYSNEVYSWGRNVFGQLGHGTLGDEYRPRRLEDFDNIVIQSVYCGQHHSVSISEDAAVYTWGRGELGALGHTYNKSISRPRKVDSIAHLQIVKAACGLNHTLVLTSEGKLISWGRGSYGQLGHGSGKPSKIAPVEMKIPKWMMLPEKRRIGSRPASCPPGFSLDEMPSPPQGRNVQSAHGDREGERMFSESSLLLDKPNFNPHPGRLRANDRFLKQQPSLSLAPNSPNQNIMKELMEREMRTGALQKELQKSKR